MHFSYCVVKQPMLSRSYAARQTHNRWANDWMTEASTCYNQLVEPMVENETKR